MKLYIAEKPSLAKAIIAVLPKPHQKGDGFIKASNGDTVTWCIGHLLEQAPPEDYDEKYKKWSVEHLPIIPQVWQLKPKARTRKQLNVIKKLVKQANILVNAGDADRVTINTPKIDYSLLQCISNTYSVIAGYILDTSIPLKSLTNNTSIIDILKLKTNRLLTLFDNKPSSTINRFLSIFYFQYHINL